MFPPDPPPVLDLQLLAGAGARLLAHQVRGPGHRGLAPQPANQRGDCSHVTRCRALIGHLVPGRRVARWTAAVTVTV